MESMKSETPYYDLITEIGTTLMLLGAESDILSVVASAGKEISMQQAIGDLRNWNKSTLEEMREIVNLATKSGIL